jgi:beta-glucosidase
MHTKSDFGRIAAKYSSLLIFLLGAIGRPALAAATDDYDARARAIVAQMTLQEKIAELHGTQNKTNFRVVIGLPRLSIPDLLICNGPAGVGPAGPGHGGPATALPAPISLAATWDTNAAWTFGHIAGRETALLGNMLLEAPDINIARTPHGGRTFESFGEDPFLTSQLAAANIQGIQSCGVMANVKHYAANNQEKDRGIINEIIDERTLREIYLPGFEASVKEGRVASVMSAYNKVNGSYCCENDYLQNQVLKKDWGFDGFILSDYGAVHSTAPSATNGLDLEMPSGIYFAEPLLHAVQSGEIPESLLDEKLVRRFRTTMRFGLWDQQPARGPIPSGDAALARRIGAEGVVLLQNNAGLLPLKADAIHSIALIGPFAGKAMIGGGGSSRVIPFVTVNPVDGIRNYVGNNVTVQTNSGEDIAQAVAAAKSADVVILMLGDRQSEGKDHPITLGGNQDELAAAVLAANPHTVVVLKTGGPVLMPWVNQAPAIVEAWYPGEEDGDVVAAVLFGAVNPSGKLPVTFPRSDADLPEQTPEQYPGTNHIAHYSEGLLVGYRWYDAKNIEPLFPFGHGLSYTTFDYSKLKLSRRAPDGSVTVKFTLRNTGASAGAEVAQLYLSLPSTANALQPPRALKGFRRIELASGKSARISIGLDDRALSYWDVVSHSWKIAPGVYTVSIGSSSRDLRLSGTFEIKI